MRLINYVKTQTPYDQLEYGYGQLTVRIAETEYNIEDIDNEHIRRNLTQLLQTLEKLTITEIIIDTA